LGEHVQSVAEDYGWKGTIIDANHQCKGDDLCDCYYEAWSEAEDWLNDEYSDDNHYWGSLEGGDWGYWATEDHEPTCQGGLG